MSRHFLRDDGQEAGPGDRVAIVKDDDGNVVAYQHDPAKQPTLSQSGAFPGMAGPSFVWDRALTDEQLQAVNAILEECGFDEAECRARFRDAGLEPAR